LSDDTLLQLKVYYFEGFGVVNLIICVFTMSTEPKKNLEAIDFLIGKTHRSRFHLYFGWLFGLEFDFLNLVCIFQKFFHFLTFLSNVWNHVPVESLASGKRGKAHWIFSHDTAIVFFDKHSFCESIPTPETSNCINSQFYMLLSW